MRNHKLKVLSVALLLLSGCSNTGNGAGDTGAVSTAEEAVTLENPVRLDQLGVLPASNNSAASYLLQLTNYSKDKYTLDSVRVIDLDTGKDSKLVSVASQACSTVSANGSCSIQLTPHTSQSADVKLEVNLKDKLGTSTKLVQLIRISGELNANNGGIVMLNDVDRIVTEDGNYSLSIPVVLGDSYDDIKASNGSLICNTKGYQKGSSCTYQVKGKVLSSTRALSGIKALSSTRAALSETNEVIVVSTRLEGIKDGKTATLQEANTKVEIAKGAHLLLSHGTKINAPNTSGEITVFNNGNITATDITTSVENLSGLKIETAASACGKDIVANGICKVKVSVSSTTNGQGSVKVAYKDNGKDSAAQTNVRYTVANASAGVTLTATSNNLANAIVGGKTREAIIEVKNTGNRILEGVSYYLAPAGNSGLTVEKGAENGCDLTGAKLEVQQTCNLSVKYKPLAAFEGNKSINLVINSRYIDQNEQSHSLISAIGLDYSAIKVGSGNLVWSTNSGNGDLAIVSNGNDTGSTIWELRNTLSQDENLPAKNVNVTLNPATIDGLSVAATDKKACPANAIIAGNSACQYKVSYGPTREERKQTDVDLNANYNFYDETPEVSRASFKVASSAEPQPKIDVAVKVNPTDGTTVAGDGSLQSPWSFNAYHDKTISLQYTFTNSGTLGAEKFNLDTGNLPRGAALKDTTCPTGFEAEKLALGGSCIANVDIPDPELFGVPNLTTNSLNSASLKFDLPYSYQYNGRVYHGEGDTKYAKFNRLWATVQHSIANSSFINDADVYEFGVKTDVTGLDNAAQSYPITVTPTLSNPIPGVTLAPCTIENASTTNCINKISLPKNMFVAGSDLLVTFEVSANAMDANNKIISTYPVRLLRAELASPLKMSDNRNVVPFGVFKNKIINTPGKKYPFELTLSAPNGARNLGFSDIKLSDSSVLASGTKVTLVNNSCKQENSPPADGICKVEGTLEFELAEGLKWKNYENKSMFLVLEATYNNQVLHSAPVRLTLDSILINVRQVNLPATGEIRITLQGVDDLSFNYIIPNGANTGVIASPIVEEEWDRNGANTIKVHAVNTASAATPVDLSLFVWKANSSKTIDTLNTGSFASNTKAGTIGLSVDSGFITKYSKAVYDYAQKNTLTPAEYQQFNASLAPGIYQAGFYLYGKGWKSSESNGDKQALEYIQLNYERK